MVVVADAVFHAGRRELFRFFVAFKGKMNLCRNQLRLGKQIIFFFLREVGGGQGGKDAFRQPQRVRDFLLAQKTFRIGNQHLIFHGGRIALVKILRRNIGAFKQPFGNFRDRRIFGGAGAEQQKQFGKLYPAIDHLTVHILPALQIKQQGIGAGKIPAFDIVQCVGQISESGKLLLVSKGRKIGTGKPVFRHQILKNVDMDAFQPLLDRIDRAV